MKHLNEFIIEKLKINKNTQTEEEFTDRYVIVIPYGSIYNNIYIEFEDSLVISSAGHPNMFVIDKDLLDDNLFDHSDVCIYKIPDEYKDFDSIESAWDDGIIDLDDLETYKE